MFRKPVAQGQVPEFETVLLLFRIGVAVIIFDHLGADQGIGECFAQSAVTELQSGLDFIVGNIKQVFVGLLVFLGRVEGRVAPQGQIHGPVKGAAYLPAQIHVDPGDLGFTMVFPGYDRLVGRADVLLNDYIYLRNRCENS